MQDPTPVHHLTSRQKYSTMNLVATEPEHLEALKTWFPDKASVRQWGGPEFRHPFTGQNFLEDMRWQKLPAFSLLGETGELTGFGQ